MYYVLNLARGLAAASQGEVLSKEQGGAWGIRHLPVCYRPLIETALKAYKGSEKAAFDKERLREYADYVIKKCMLAKNLPSGSTAFAVFPGGRF